MSRSTLLAMLVLLTLAVVGGALWLGQDDGPTRDVAPSVPAAPDDATKHDVAPLTVAPVATGEVEALAENLGAAATPASQAADDTRPPIARILGTVVHEDGEPVADVLVELSVGGGPTLVTPQGQRTDAEGRFVFEFDDSVEIVRSFVGAGERSASSHSLERVLVARGEERELTLTVGPGASLAGRVETLEGHAVPRATVLLWSRSQWDLVDAERLPPPDRSFVADNDGRFGVPALGPDFVLAAEAPGMACTSRLHGRLEAGRDLSELKILMAPAANIFGTVRTSDGALVEDAQLHLAPPPIPKEHRSIAADDVFALQAPRHSARTDGDGRFAFDGVAPGRRTLSADHGDYASSTLMVDADDSPIEVVLRAGGVLEGTVFGADGAPVAHASVRLNFYEAHHASTDVDGHYRIAGLGAITAGTLLVRADDHAIEGQHPLELERGGHLAVDVQLHPERVLAGTLVDAEGQPVAGADMSIEGDRVVDTGNVVMSPKPTWERAMNRSTTSTDAQGRFVFGSLYVGDFELSATDPNDEELRARWTLSSGQDDLRLVLDPSVPSGVTLVGRVTDAQTGAPITEFSLTPMFVASNGGASGSARQFEDPDGRFRWSGVEPGRFYLTAKAAEYSERKLATVDYEDGVHEFAITLSPERSLHLRCVDAEGAPIEGLNLTFEDAKSESLMVAVGPGSFSSRISTDKNGEARAHSLPAETVTVIASEWGLFRNKEQRYSFDLWSELPLMQTLVFDGSGERTERALAVMLLGGAPAGLQAMVGNPRDAQLQETLEDLVGSAENLEALRSLEQPFDLIFRADSGDTILASYGPGAGGDWVFLVDDVVTPSSNDQVFPLTIPLGGGTLTVATESSGTQTLRVPGGSEDQLASFFFGG